MIVFVAIFQTVIETRTEETEIRTGGADLVHVSTERDLAAGTAAGIRGRGVGHCKYLNHLTYPSIRINRT